MFLTTAGHASGKTAIFAAPPVLGISTLYPVIGEIFGLLSVAGLLIMAIWAMIAGRKAKK